MALARCALINVPPCIALVLNKGPTRVFHVLTCCTPPQSTNREMDGPSATKSLAASSVSFWLRPFFGMSTISSIPIETISPEPPRRTGC